MTEGDSTLKINVRVERGAARFVLDVAFDAKPGVTILFGSSGSGKSTLLSAIAGISEPSRGTIQLGQQTWFDSDRGISWPIHRRHIAFVFQSLALFPHMTAIGNVVYGMDQRLARSQRDARAESILDRLHIAHLAHRRPSTFSGGEAQRVALARAFAMSPALVLLDEPFSALDAQLRRELVSDVASLVADLGVPLLHVTHDRAEALALGDRVIILERGRIVASGSASELLSMA